MSCSYRAAETFRRVFGAEAVVEVEEASEERVTARFSGNMCYTCGTYDYFEDFAYALSDCAGEEWGVEEYRQMADGSYRVVFKPKKSITKRGRHVKVIIYGQAYDVFL